MMLGRLVQRQARRLDPSHPRVDRITLVLLLRQVPVRFPVVSDQTPIPFQKPRNEYEIGPQKGRGAHARIRTGDLFLTKEMLYRLSYVGGAAASRFYRAGENTLAAQSCLLPSTKCTNWHT